MPRALAVALTGVAAGLLFGGRLTCLLFGCWMGLLFLGDFFLAGKMERSGLALLRVFTLVLLPLGVSMLLFQSLPDWLSFSAALLGLGGNPFFTSYAAAFSYTALPLLLCCMVFSLQGLRRLVRRGAQRFPFPDCGAGGGGGALWVLPALFGGKRVFRFSLPAAVRRGKNKVWEVNGK